MSNLYYILNADFLQQIEKIDATQSFYFARVSWYINLDSYLIPNFVYTHTLTYIYMICKRIVSCW